MAKLKFTLCELVRPITTRLPRGKHVLLRFAGGEDVNDTDWRSAPNRHRVFFDKNLGAYIAVDLAQWQSRWHYYDGAYGEKDVPLLIRRFMRPGDTFIDIGANYGIHTLLGAKLVGDAGKVFAFEPNPDSYDRTKAHLTINGIRNTTVYQMGLGDAPGELQLSGGDKNTGEFTLRPVPGATHQFKVQINRLDDVISPDQLQNRTLIKIDTEGFEHHVLRGMDQILTYPNLAIICEVTDQWLRQTGSSAQQLIDFLTSKGFKPHTLHLSWSGLTHVLDIRPMTTLPTDVQYDVFFTRDGFHQ